MLAEEVFATVPAPTGRVTFEGTVVSAREVESDYKLIPNVVLWVRVDTPRGCWFVHVTAPKSLMDEAHRCMSRYGPAFWFKGKKVAMTATLKKGKEKFRAIGKYPRDGKICAS